ncbi:MAG: amidohydrolase family protein [Anaerolineae bacterium]|nr:amidohydrolase family protein [Anaerolineae bacterium]
MRLFDINCFVGGWTTESYPIADAGTLADEMARLGIEGALVRHSWGWLHDPAEGNAALLGEIAGHHQWRPCLAATPLPEDMGALDHFLASVRRSAAGAVTLYPASQHFSLTRWGAGELLDALAAWRLPVLLEYQEITWPSLAEVLAGWPALPVVVTRTGYRILRNLLPMLRTYPNLYVDMAYLGDNLALEHISQHYGAERVLFGTGTPRVDGAGSVARLAMSTLPDEQKQQIGAGNAERLLADAVTQSVA